MSVEDRRGKCLNRRLAKLKKCEPIYALRGIGPAGGTTNATATTIGTGQAKTTTIIAVQGAGTYAARLCDDLVVGGYSDWFLPSQAEPGLMYTNLLLYSAGNFTTVSYWSSTEVTPDQAISRYFDPPGHIEDPALKSSNYRVRAVWAF